MAPLPFTGPDRGLKPRERGLTSIIDFGPDGFGWTGPRGVQDLLDVAADHIDYAKIYAMNALLIPEEIVTRIVRLYRDADVTPYAGGILFEHAAYTGQIDGYIDHLRKLGIETAEVSENYLQFSDATRQCHIETLQRAGITVIYEFGLKNPTEPFDLERLETIVQSNIDQGVRHVIVEQSEIDMARSRSPGLLEELASRPWFRYILIEADPYRFPSQHAQLLDEFGPGANLANIAAGQALRLEGMRRGVGRSVNYAMFKE